MAKLQEERTVRKICLLDSHVVMAFAGLTADARILINRAQVECQSHKLSVEDPVTLEYITRFVLTYLFIFLYIISMNQSVNMMSISKNR